jgi:uncharacterized protein YebE (UPF0316 family)
MQVIHNLPIWLLVILIFLLRVVDVTLGTIRTISVVQGWIKVSVLLGFFEVLIWIAAVSQVISRINEHPILMIAYATGFATGNAAGILLERRLALGSCVVRIISSTMIGLHVAETLRSIGQRVTTFEGEGRDGPRVLIYATCERRYLSKLIEAAQAVDPHLFYAVERAAESSHLSPLPHANGWRGVLRKK